VLEPIQTAGSLTGQVEELRAVLEDHAQLPATLIGFSWGAWLSFIVAARHPGLVEKLVLVGSGPFEERYAGQVLQTRLDRLCPEQRVEFESILDRLSGPAAEGQDALLARLGALTSKTDAYAPCEEWQRGREAIDLRPDIFRAVWTEAARLRKAGDLVRLGRRITCPVVAIHGSYDPHPVQGVGEPLAAVLRDFRLVVLESCGHRPWIERRARDAFYRVLARELP
jgi:pimeloyl-ACP methyl ester carboxylesterase